MDPELTTSETSPESALKADWPCLQALQQNEMDALFPSDAGPGGQAGQDLSRDPRLRAAVGLPTETGTLRKLKVPL